MYWLLLALGAYGVLKGGGGRAEGGGEAPPTQPTATSNPNPEVEGDRDTPDATEEGA